MQNYPRGAKALRGALTRFGPQDTVAWFAARGVYLKTEADGRMFPVTNTSETIVECLIKSVATSGVKLRVGTHVTSVKRSAADEGFDILLKSGETIKCDRLLLATGSSIVGYKIVRDLGHQIEPPVPSLFTLTLPIPNCGHWLELALTLRNCGYLWAENPITTNWAIANYPLGFEWARLF